MTKLCQYVDVCIGNEEDADTTLGFKASNTDVTKGELNLDGYKEVFMQMKDKFGFKFIASSLRESHSASDNGWSALVYDGHDFTIPAAMKCALSIGWEVEIHLQWIDLRIDYRHEHERCS